MANEGLLFCIEQVKREILSGGEAIKALEILREKVNAALEAEPLAVVEGWMSKFAVDGMVKGYDSTLVIHLDPDSEVAGVGVPVTATITEGHRDA